MCGFHLLIWVGETGGCTVGKPPLCLFPQSGESAESLIVKEFLLVCLVVDCSVSPGVVVETNGGLFPSLSWGSCQW